MACDSYRAREGERVCKLANLDKMQVCRCPPVAWKLFLDLVKDEEDEEDDEEVDEVEIEANWDIKLAIHEGVQSYQIPPNIKKKAKNASKLAREKATGSDAGQ